MFSKDVPKTQSTGSGGTPTLNMISEGTRMTGDINSKNDIRISGSIDGEANSEGRVIVTSTGQIDGNIKAKDADIAGKLDGELFIAGKLILRKSAVINGDIHTKTLLVEEGAQITGNCKMGVDSSKNIKSIQGSNNDNKSVKEGAV